MGLERTAGFDLRIASRGNAALPRGGEPKQEVGNKLLTVIGRATRHSAYSHVPNDMVQRTCV